ncbi:hypothetical protein GCM10009678_87760 [Actinomadura kijaniata]|uniref:Uncharacterized protein n=1 Tax=Actinomadura namibiensis TaxID=182080 RepID=A0A7W3QKD3_ACTNM|nr:hypothetical protein [Actinomadura namibiensis]MBA8949843.1 hypothetical protein [Actinomadura namibiensis]
MAVSSRAEYAGAALLLARRYAANVPAAQRNDVDRVVWAALDKVPGARDVLERAVRRVDNLPEDRKRAMFGGTYAFKPVGTVVPPRELEQIIDRLGGTATPGGPTPTRHRYELEFSHLVCDDESNPEWLGKDEPYTVFTLITQREAEEGEPARSVRTPVYKVGEGERAPASGSEDLRLFGRTGPAVLDSDVLVTAAHFEHDLGDITKIVTELGVLLTAVAAVAKAAKKDLAAIVLGALGTIAGFVATIGADDPVGEPQAMLLTEADADARTQSQAQVTLPALKFNGGDPSGTYRAFLTLRRA